MEGRVGQQFRMNHLQPKFVIYRDAVGAWRYRFLCRLQVQRLRSSEGYNARSSAEAAVLCIQQQAAQTSQYHTKVNTLGHHFFTLSACEGRVIGMSRVLSDKMALAEDQLVLRAQAEQAEVVIAD